jgi:hypothetical protein
VFSTAGDAARHTLNFTFGLFTPRPEDGRVDEDVLVANLNFPQFLLFEVDEFNSFTFGAEWLIPIGNHIEAGAGFNFSRKTVPAIYSLLSDSDGTEIDQDLSLRIMPIAFTVRALPLSQSQPVQPYVGGGIGLFTWKYKESGEFVDFTADPIDGDCTDLTDNCPLFETPEDDPFEGSGTDVGFIFLFGVRYAADSFSVGGEARYHKATGDLPEDEFFGTKVDLGGWVWQGTFGFRF